MPIQSHKKFEMYGFNSHSVESFGLSTFPFININVCDNPGKSTFLWELYLTSSIHVLAEMLNKALKSYNNSVKL